MLELMLIFEKKKCHDLKIRGRHDLPVILTIMTFILHKNERLKKVQNNKIEDVADKLHGQ